MLEFGEVDSFDEDRGYGYLEVLNDQGELTGTRIFFHIADARWVGIQDGEIIFVGRESPETHARVKSPAHGAVLAFQRGFGKGGRKRAKPWTPAENYHKLVEKMTS